MATNFQLMHQMVLRQVQTQKENELWFRVGGYFARFSIFEFHVITGLPCEERVCNISKKVSISEFFGQKKMTHNDLVARFISESKKSKKKLIMAKLLLIERLIVYRRSEVVSAQFLSLACNEKKFELYPWGRESYTRLLKSLKSSSVADRAGVRGSYQMYGYCLAFQSWILEAFPALSAKIDCNFMMPDRDPYSLHWVCEFSHSYVEAEHLFHGDLTPLFPTYGEFARTAGMGFADEKDDPVVDASVEEVCGGAVDDALYDSRRFRQRAYAARFSNRVVQAGGEEANISEKGDEAETSKRKTPVKRGKTAGKKQDGKSFETAFQVFPEVENKDVVESSKKRKSESGGMAGKKKKKVASSDTAEGLVYVRRGRSAARQCGRVVPSENVKIINADTDMHEEGDVVASPSKRGRLVTNLCDLLDDDTPLKFVFQRRYKMKKAGLGSGRPLYDSTVDMSSVLPSVSLGDNQSTHGVENEEIHAAGFTSGGEGSDGDDKVDDFTADTHSCGSDELAAPPTAGLSVLAEVADVVGCADKVEGGEKSSGDRRGEVETSNAGTEGVSPQMEAKNDSTGELPPNTHGDGFASSTPSYPDWVKEIFKRIEKLEDVPQRMDVLGARVDAIESKIAEMAGMLGVVGEMAMRYDELEVRVSNFEAMFARSQVNPGNADDKHIGGKPQGSPVKVVDEDVSAKIVNDVVADLQKCFSADEEMVKSSPHSVNVEDVSLPSIRSEGPTLDKDILYTEIPPVFPTVVADNEGEDVGADVKVFKDLKGDISLTKNEVDDAKRSADEFGIPSCSAEVARSAKCEVEGGDAVVGVVGGHSSLEKFISLSDDEYDTGAGVDWDSVAKDTEIINEVEKLKASNLIPSTSTFLYGPAEIEKKVRILKHVPNKSLISFEDHEFMYGLVKKKRNFSVAGPISRWDKKFFLHIISKNMWLDCQHLEAGLIHFRRRISEDPVKYREVLVLDWLFYLKYLPDYASNYGKDLPLEVNTEEYFVGMCPAEYGKPWESVKKVYTIFNVINKHWVALEIMLEERVINVYDCNVTAVKAGVLEEQLQPFAIWFPIHLAKAGLYQNFASSPFQLNMVDDLMHDSTGASCGVFTLKTIEASVFGGDVKRFNNEKLFRYRELMCSDLIKETWSFRF